MIHSLEYAARARLMNDSDVSHILLSASSLFFAKQWANKSRSICHAAQNNDENVSYTYVQNLPLSVLGLAL